jgi:hypothetical protein
VTTCDKDGGGAKKIMEFMCRNLWMSPKPWGYLVNVEVVCLFLCVGILKLKMTMKLKYLI